MTKRILSEDENEALRELRKVIDKYGICLHFGCGCCGAGLYLGDKCNDDDDLSNELFSNEVK
jgi:hypothetical protein